MTLFLNWQIWIVINITVGRYFSYICTCLFTWYSKSTSSSKMTIFQVGNLSFRKTQVTWTLKFKRQFSLSCLSNIICTTCDCLTTINLIQGRNNFPFFIQISVGCGDFKNFYHWNKKGKWLVEALQTVDIFEMREFDQLIRWEGKWFNIDPTGPTQNSESESESSMG